MKWHMLKFRAYQAWRALLNWIRGCIECEQRISMRETASQIFWQVESETYYLRLPGCRLPIWHRKRPGIQISEDI